MKDVEIRLVSELMKNSRRSDRELAKALGVSQPTVSRTKAKLEEEGVIREYTMIPDFSKLGFSMISISFVSLKAPIGEQDLNEVRKKVHKTLQSEPIPTILAMSGMGLSSDRVIIAFHESFSAYTEHVNRIKQHPLVRVEDFKSFLIDLQDKNQYLPLTLSELAEYLVHIKLQT